MNGNNSGAIVLVTFNELLSINGIDFTQVTLLRHSGKQKQSGLTPHDLWQRWDGSFDKYQSTQAAGAPRFKSPYWASFVSTPANETLFVGLYAATLGDRTEINWLCPITGMPPGADKGCSMDFYHLTLLNTLSEHRGNLKVQWDAGQRVWAQYAHRNNRAVIGSVDTKQIAVFASSPEGEATWHMQRKAERSSSLASAVLKKNAETHGGFYACEACGFQHSDRAMFDVHHSHPLLAGPRRTRAADLIILCPLCHRRAHRSTNRMLPYSLIELQDWAEAGRP